MTDMINSQEAKNIDSRYLASVSKPEEFLTAVEFHTAERPTPGDIVLKGILKHKCSSLISKPEVSDTFQVCRHFCRDFLPSQSFNTIPLMPAKQWLSRTELLIGPEKLNILRKKHVLIAGLGGVGAMAAEQVCRAGVGIITIIDGDTVHTSNRNRQLPALKSTEGIAKTEVMAKRLLDINPALELTILNEYIKDERILEILQQNFDYVVDAIDTLSPKVLLLYNCIQLGIPVVSSMGAGGKFDPAQVLVADIDDSYNCKLAYYLRKRLHKMGVWKGIKVVFSTEMVERSSVILQEGESNKKSNVGTISYMPAIFGCFCASVVLRDLIQN